MKLDNSVWAALGLAALVAACGGGSEGDDSGGDAGSGPVSATGGSTAMGGADGLDGGPSTGGESATSSGGNVATVSFSQEIQPIFDAWCTGCHSSSGTASFLPLTSGAAYDNLVGASSTRTGTPPSGLRVEPGSSSESVLYQRVSGDGLAAGESTMPPTGSGLSDAQLALVRTWIDEGAPNN